MLLYYRVNGHPVPKENMKILTEIELQVMSEGGVSSLACNIASEGRLTARNLIASTLSIVTLYCLKKYSSSHQAMDESSIYEIGEEERSSQTIYNKRRRKEEKLKDRGDQNHGTWEHVYQSSKKADQNKNDSHKRTEGELPRTGQTLCFMKLFLKKAGHFCNIVHFMVELDSLEKVEDKGWMMLMHLHVCHYLTALATEMSLVNLGLLFADSNHINHIHKNS